MNQWTNIALELPELREKIDRHEYSEAEAQCTEYITGHTEEVSDELIGVFIVRAHCRAALERRSDAINDHAAALAMIGDDIGGDDLFEIANDAVNAGLPLEYGAELLHRAADIMKHSPDRHTNGSRYSEMLIASAINKEGICHYKAGSPVEQEIACYSEAEYIIERIADPNEDEILLKALIKSNLAECHARNEDYIEASELYRQAGAIYDGRRKKSAVCAEQHAMCLRSLSDINRSAGDNVAAHNYLSMTIQTLEEHPDGAVENVLEQLSSCYNARGTLRFQMGDYEGEISDCTTAIELRSGLDADHFALATIYANRAEAHERCDDFESAAEDYRSAIRELENKVDEFSECKALMAVRLYSLGECLRATEKPKEAMDAFRECAGILYDIRDEQFENFSREQLNDTEAYCRMWMAQLALSEPFTDYHLAMTETRRSIALFEESVQTGMAAMRIAFLHSVLAEIYEMFDEPESAAEEYRISQEILDNAAANGDDDEDEEVDDEDDIWDDPSGTIPQA